MTRGPRRTAWRLAAHPVRGRALARRAGVWLAGVWLAGVALGRSTPADAQDRAPAARARVGVSVRPDTVTVGDPFVVVVRVQAPAGATVAFPPEPDSGGAVALLDPRRVATQPVPGDPAGAVDHLATYRMAAWDVGDQAIPLGAVVVREGGAERRVGLGALGVYVRSVLPADSALRVPKPVRAPLADAGPWWARYWPWIVAALVALLVIAWLVRRWLRRRGDRPAESPYRRAVGEFERVERMRLVESGEGGRHVALVVEVVRDYVAARLPNAATSLTSGELVAALADREDVPSDRLARVLEVADLVKFAALPIDADGARGAAAEARAVVDEIERRVREREQRDADAEVAQRRAATAAARKYEDERRREQSRREAA